MRIAIWIIAFSAFLLSCSGNKNDLTTEYNIIPLPNEIIPQQGKYLMQGEVRVSSASDTASIKVINYLNDILNNTDIKLKNVAVSEEADIYFIADNSLKDEAYILNITPDNIKISSNQSGSGLFYGIQSLLQLMPAEIYNHENKYDNTIEIPAVKIVDAPQFPHRGAMMDVGRNFLPKETVFKFLDLMAIYKMNKFHFHLTEDQGWRIEIKKYPKLTEVGSKRSQTQIGHSDFYYPKQYDEKPHQGYYTQDEIKEIVQYASDRFITVIPEIEMPGHASAALAAYPHLSCGLGKTYVVRDYYDVFDEVFCPKETTFSFLEDVLSEVIELFPSDYIHIGGDECPKKAWKKCNHCQALIKKEGLANEDELQSWFIHRIEKFLNSKGRNIIGWDEILEGGLAPNATVMSWRGEAGGIEAARLGHNVIMTPDKKCYLDYYQENIEQAPVAMGGFLPLDSVYYYNPLSEKLTPEQQSYIIGLQANIWGEYIQTQEYFEYMAFPRLLAIAEVQWQNPDRKDFNSFTQRLDKEFERLNYMDVNACRNFYEVNHFGTWNDSIEAFQVELKTFAPGATIYYNINDSIVDASSNQYSKPVLLPSDARIYAVAYRDGKPLAKITSKGFIINKATGKNYTCTPKADWEHLDKGTGLTDGKRGFTRDLQRWVCFVDDSVQIVIDLTKPEKIEKVAFGSLWRPWSTIWPVKAASVSVSMNGVDYTTVAQESFHYDYKETESTNHSLSLSFSPVEAKFVRLELINSGLCPKGFYDEGQQTEFAIDEIEIY